MGYLVITNFYILKPNNKLFYLNRLLESTWEKKLVKVISSLNTVKWVFSPLNQFYTVYR